MPELSEMAPKSPQERIIMKSHSNKSGHSTPRVKKTPTDLQPCSNTSKQIVFLNSPKITVPFQLAEPNQIFQRFILHELVTAPQDTISLSIPPFRSNLYRNLLTLYTALVTRHLFHTKLQIINHHPKKLLTP